MTVRFRAMSTDLAFSNMLEGRPCQLADEYPFYPLDSPGLPEPGVNFLREARAMAGDPDSFLPDDAADMKILERKRASKELYQSAVNRELTKLYHQALYDDDFQLTLDMNGRFRSVAFVPGHQWDYDADGPRESRVMVVSKAPGFEEAEAKRNFAGPTGRLFQEVLVELGFENFFEWYVTNTVRFVNPRAAQSNDLAAAWIKDCLPLLHQELRLVKPEFLLLLGSEAIAAVLGKGQNYKNTNGRVIELEVPLHLRGEEPRIHRVKVVTSLHPAAVSHDPSKRDDLYKALRYFKAALNGSLATVSDPEADREHIFCFGADHLNSIAARMEDEKRREFAIDCEFDGDTPIDGKLHTVQFSWEEKKACVVNLRDIHGAYTFDGGPHAARRLLTRIFKGREKRIIGHYFNADLWWLKDMGLGFLQDQFEVPGDDPDPDGVERLFGWQKLMTAGGFDTILAAHAVEETAELGLKDQTLKLTTIGPYDVELEAWKKRHIKELGCKMSELPGFGACPRPILLPYAAYDCDGTFRLYRAYNESYAGKFALLDSDRFGMSSRIPFWISMRACLTFYEMHETGMFVDVSRAEELYDLYTEVKGDLLKRLREKLKWPEFKASSPIHCKEFLFGTPYNGKIQRDTGINIQVRPEGAVSLGLEPYKSTGKRPKLWDQIRARGKEDEYTPAVDKETLEVYSRKYKQYTEIQDLLDLRYIQQITRSVLQDPRKAVDDDGILDFELDDDGNRIYDRGLLSFLQSTGTVHTNFSQTKDTGRASSWQPPLQNISKKREPDYMRIAGAYYKHSIRSIFVAPPGYALITADYTGAELMGMAIQAGEKTMIDHCLRSLLPDKGYSEEGEKCEHGPTGADGNPTPDPKCKACKYPHPRYYDIHANVTVKAFQPKYPDGRSCREGRLARFDLKEAGLGHLRDAAKPVDFGYAYGMTADAAYRRAREGGANVTRDDSQALLDGLERLYPCLPPYYAEAASRSRDPMHITNCMGRRRRTYYTDDPKAIGDIERKFKNFPIQSLVADVMSIAFANFRDYRRTHPHLRYKAAMQVYDDAVLLVPIPQVEEVYDKVIPYCMTEAVDIWPCRLDGSLRDDPAAPYHLVPDRHVYLRWGAEITKAEAEAVGLPLRFAGKGG